MNLSTRLKIVCALLFSNHCLLGGLPDLAVTSLKAPRAITNAFNPQLTLSWTIKNQGTAGVSSFWDGLYISTNSTLTTDAIFLGSWYMPSVVEPGSSYTNGATTQLPIGFSGRYYLFVQTDIYNSVAESNEGNNVIRASLDLVNKPPDLAPIASLVPATLNTTPTAQVTLIWAVTNNGPGEATGNWQDAVYLSTNSALTPDAFALGFFTTPSSVLPGQTYWKTNYIRFPSVTKGNYFLLFKTDVGNSLYETNLDNNVLAVPVALNIQPPALTPVSLQVPRRINSLQPYPSVNIVYEIANQGGGPAYGFWTDALIFSADGVLDSLNDYSFATRNESGPVLPGNSYWRTNVVQLPVTRSGSFYIFLETDLGDDLLETPNHSRTLGIPIDVVIPQPDLQPLAFAVPSIATNTPNPTLLLSWGVTNFGPGEAVAPWQDAIYLSTNSTFDSSATQIFWAYESSSINAAQDYWRTNAVRLPVTESGLYYLFFRADDGNTLAESNLSNNVIVKPLQLAIVRPNLAPIAMLFTNPVSGPPNLAMQIVWGVTNQGLGAASGYWLDSLYLSADDKLDSSDRRIFSGYENALLDAGKSYWRTNLVNIPLTQSGSFYLIFEADDGGAGSILESDYTDNAIAVPVSFDIHPPDLLPVTSRLPKTLTGSPYPETTIVWGITNRGSGPAAGLAWIDRIYFSSNAILGPTDPVLAFAYNSGPLDPGAVLWQTNTVRLPVTNSGTYNFIVSANENQYLFESNYSNNLAVAPVNVTIHAPDLAPIALRAPSTLTGPPYPTVTVSWGITNYGPGLALGNPAWSDRLYVSTKAAWDLSATEVFADYLQGPVFAAGSYWRTNSFHLPLTASGTYYLFLAPNGDRELIESTYTNNLIRASMQFTMHQPDLAPFAVLVSTNVTGPPNPSVTYAWGVTNLGKGTAQAYPINWIDVVSLAASNVTAWDQSQPQMSVDYHYESAAPGEVYWRTNTVRVPLTQSGAYHLIFNTDAYRSLLESDYSNNSTSVPITFNIQPPDLAPIALVVSNSIAAQPNPKLTVVWGITNQGIGPAGPLDYWNDLLYLSTNSLWDPQATLIFSEQRSGTIRPGETYWRTNLLTFPLTASGTYYLILKTDPADSLLESDTNNNTAVAPLTFTSLPADIAPIVLPISQVITGPPNPGFNLIWGTTNQGIGPAVSQFSWNDAIFLSTDTNLDFQDPFVFNLNESGPIAPGQISWHTNLVFPPIVQSGSYYLIVEVNSGAPFGLFESDYSNNVAAVPVTFDIQYPDLVPVSLNIPSQVTATPNPRLNIVWAVTNQGPGLATSTYGRPNWVDFLYFSQSPAFDPSAQILTTDAPPTPVAAGDTYWRTNSVSVPVVQSGTYYFFFRANANQALLESDYSNNIISIPVTFDILPPDLSPLAIQVPAIVTNVPNPRLSIAYAVTNSGIGAAQGNWTDVLYFSPTNVLDDRAVQLAYYGETGPIPSGGTYWQTNLASVPVVNSGKYFLILLVNSGNYLFETDYTNNLLTIPVTFTIQNPDLTPIALRTPSQVTGPPNPTLNLAWGVTNQGVGPAIPNGFWADRIYFSTTPAFNQYSSQPLLTRYRQESMPSGGQYWDSQWTQIPALTNGTYYLILRTDDDNAVHESNENNNSLAVPVTFTIQQPDLAPLSLQIPGSITSSPLPMVKFTWGVTNRGTGPAEPLWVDALYLSKDAILDPGDTQITQHYEQNALPAGSAYLRSETVQIPVTNSGNYFVLFHTDDRHNLYESNTGNDILAVPVTFNISAPDLAPIAFLVSSNVTSAPNPTLTLVWGVTNQGNGSIPASTFHWFDQVFLSMSPAGDPDSYPIFSADQTGAVPAHGVYWRTNSISVPLREDGTFYLILRVNFGLYPPLIESDYNNNTLVVPITYQVQRPDLSPIFLQSWTRTPDSPYPLINLAWGVTNQGSGPTTNIFSIWTVTASLTKTNEADGSTVSLGNWEWEQTNLIPAGQTYWATNSFRSQAVESGTYQLTLTVNQFDSLANTNNDSITNLLSMTIAPPDVSPVFFGGPTIITNAGLPTVTLAWGVTNTGSAIFGQPYFLWFDLLYLSTNAFLDDSATVLQAWQNFDSLDSGASYWRTNTVELPIKSSGKYYLILQLDPYGALHEANVSNNLAILPFTFELSPPSDLVPLRFLVQTNITGSANPTVNLTWGVTNQGPGAAEAPFGWIDSVYVSTLPSLDGQQSYVINHAETNTVPSGGFYWRTNVATLPISISGKYYLLFDVNAANSAAETDYANNLKVIPFTFTRVPPDLKPISLYAPATVTSSPNPTITVVVGVTNQGSGIALPAYDALYISATTAVDSSAKLVATWFRSNSLAPGHFYWRTNTVRLPVGQTGNYYLIFEADTYHTLGESAPLNNVMAIPIYLQLSPAPDLVLLDFQTPAAFTGPANPTIEVSWQVANQGFGTAVAPWSDSVLLYTNFGSFSFPLVVDTIIETSSVPVGGSYRRTNSITLPLSQSGNYTLAFQANLAGALFEQDYNNNVGYAAFNFTLATPVIQFLAATTAPDGSFQMQVSASPGRYTLQASTNLVDWIRTLDFGITNSPAWITDPGTGSVQRFYRVAPF